MQDRYKTTNIASILGIIGNIFLLIIKGIISILTNSKAMLADTLNSASDIFSSIMTYIGNKIASTPKDKDHNLGHGKAEYIYTLLISIAMILMSTKSLKDSIISLIKGSTYKFSIWLIIVCIITIITKLALYIYTNIIYKKYNNILVKANSKDHRNDAILTSLNLFACILSYYKIYYFDSLVGIIISIWIISTGISLFKESYDVLMDKAMPEEIKKRIIKIIKTHKEIKKIKHFNSTPVGHRYQVSFTIYVDGNLTTFKSHEIADTLEDEIEEQIKEVSLTVIHVNPINIKKM